MEFQGRKIVWLSSLVLDISLFKTSRLEILGHLAKRGHEVYLFATRSKTKYRTRSSGIGVVSIPLRYRPKVTPILYNILMFFLFPLYLVLKKPHFVVVEPSSPFFGLLLWKPLLSRLIGLKVVLDIRSTPTYSPAGLRNHLRTLEFNLSIHVAKKMFEGITTITALMRKEICERFRIDLNVIGVWSSGVSSSLFSPEKYTRQRMDLRRKLNLGGKFVVFYHGSHRPGLGECVRSFKTIAMGHRDIVLFLLGGGTTYTLADLAERNKLQRSVIIHDPVDYADVPKYIAMCDIGIVPLPNSHYWRYQCPLKLLEYLAMAKPVILTDIPAHRSVVGKEKCGVYISSTNPVEISKAILYAYGNKEKLEEWGASGREIVCREYDWGKKAKDLEDYLRLIDGRGAERSSL